MDAATIVTIAASIVGMGGIFAGFIWETRNKVSVLEASFTKEIAEVKAELERQGTMIEPFWQTLCDNLPAILKMHNSPDPLANVLHGTPTIEDVDNLISRIQDELSESINSGDNIKSYGYIMALAMARAKKKVLQKEKK